MARLLPTNLQHRVDSLIARQMSRVLWNPRHKTAVPPALRQELSILHDYLSDPEKPWRISIGHLIPRDPHFEFTGDASQLAGGAYSHELQLWFYEPWPDQILRGFETTPEDPSYVHINLLEFVVVILSAAATVTVIEDNAAPALHLPSIPICEIFTDNSAVVSWVSKISSRSEKGQRLVQIFAELLNRSECGFPTRHIPGKDNHLADFISRPVHLNYSCSSRFEQIFLFDARLRLYSYFQPSPEFLSVLAWALSSNEWVGRPALPSRLGRIIPAGSTISYSVWP
jgi:hypothetical protein